MSERFSWSKAVWMALGIIFWSFVLFGLVGCSTLPTTFTTENLMKVHQGMSSNEILTMFGEPKNVDVSVCGMPPNQWTCTTWEYGEFPYDRASFTFSGEHDSLKLNNFSVQRELPQDLI